MNKTETKIVETERIFNLGPQHPATHGVLRVILKIKGEKLIEAEPVIGYLHRGIEKMAENMTYDQFVPITDRLDYVSSNSNNFGYCLTVEKLMGIEVPQRAQYIRVMLAELQRIASHMVWLGTTALDLGAWTPIMLCFTERERIIDIFENITGGRLTCNYIRVGGVKQDLPDGALDQVRDFLKIFPKNFRYLDKLLTENRIWKGRNVDIGVIPPDVALSYGLTGPMLRGSGVSYDVRKDQPYSIYDQLDFDVPLGENCDCYDRYLIRMEEVRQSLRIIEQIVNKMPDGEVFSSDQRIYRSPKDKLFNSMERLAHHFVLAQEGYHPPVGEIYQAIENPRGELGFYLISDGSPIPKRLKIRSAAFSNLCITPYVIEGIYLSDVIAFMTSIDVVLGEIDR